MTSFEDADKNNNGTFTLDAGKTLTSANNVTIDAFKIDKLGTISASGVEKLIPKAATSIDRVEEGLFLEALVDIAIKNC